jgi:copper chaperone CopZ
LARLTLELPTMYADHHVVEVRRLLFELSGVEDVYASSSFQVVEIDYDDASVSPEAIEKTLADAGYQGELPMPAESGVSAAQENGNKTFFRHTAAYAQTGRTVGFAQKVPYAGRPLWPCPGMGVIENHKE